MDIWTFEIDIGRTHTHTHSIFTVNALLYKVTRRISQALTVSIYWFSKRLSFGEYKFNDNKVYPRHRPQCCSNKILRLTMMRIHCVVDITLIVMITCTTYRKNKKKMIYYALFQLSLRLRKNANNGVCIAATKKKKTRNSTKHQIT